MNGRNTFIILFCTTLLCTAFGCQPRTSKAVTNESEVLVQLVPEAAVSDLELAFKRYALKEKKIVSRPMLIYLFSYDLNTIRQTELIKKLKGSPLVTEAQSNQNVQLRN